MKRPVLMTVAAACATFACGDKSDSSSDSGSPTVEAGEQPDAQTGRFSSPPDTTPPTKLKAFSAAMGAHLGEILAVFGYPDKTDDYARIDLRRKAGSTEPADCADGTLVASITDYSTNSYTDSGLFPGSYHSYLACLYDEAGNLLAEKSLSTGRANDRQRMFVTSTTYDGNLKADFNGASFAAGVEGADARCQYHADQAGLGGEWGALLGDDAHGPRYRNPIYNGIYNLKGQRLAANRYIMWNGTLDNAVLYDETGTASENDAWTGANDDGATVYANTCADWSSTSGSGRYGVPSTLPSDGNGWRWVDYTSTTCATLNALYCVERVDADFVAPTVTAVPGGAAGEADVTVAFTSVSENVASVQINRGLGKTLQTPDCESSNYQSLRAVHTLTGSESKPFADTTVTDTIDFGGTDDHGHYHYFGCLYDAFGNVRALTAVDDMTYGTDFLRAFLTSTTFAGNAVSLVAANTACANEATAAGLTGTFKAFVSVNGTTANANVGTTNSYYYFDLAGAYAGQVMGSYIYPFGGVRTLADGTAVDDGTRLWTGSYYDGTYSSSCSDWSSNSNAVYGYAGVVAPFESYWSYFYNTSCDQALRVACFEAN